MADGAREARIPGEELIRRGLRDLEAEVESVEALLVSIGAPRLIGAGLAVPEPLPGPEQALYGLLRERYGDNAAHSRYNALVRRLVSYERAASATGIPDA